MATFTNDILPFFRKSQSNMMWRFDLTDYDAVKANAEIIYERISLPAATSQRMPPPPFQPLSQTVVAAFKEWMDDGFTM